jgi:hypothetical protein
MARPLLDTVSGLKNRRAVHFLTQNLSFILKWQSKWFQEPVFNKLRDPEIKVNSDKAKFPLSGYVNSQHNRRWSTENLMLFMKCHFMI